MTGANQYQVRDKTNGPGGCQEDWPFSIELKTRLIKNVLHLHGETNEDVCVAIPTTKDAKG